MTLLSSVTVGVLVSALLGLWKDIWPFVRIAPSAKPEAKVTAMMTSTVTLIQISLRDLLGPTGIPDPLEKPSGLSAASESSVATLAAFRLSLPWKSLHIACLIFTDEILLS